MEFDMSKHLGVGSKVRVVEPMGVPQRSTWDDDHGRISPTVKRRLQTQFFQGNPKVSAELVYVPKETEREKLRRQGLVKIRLRDPSGATLTITADPKTLQPSR